MQGYKTVKVQSSAEFVEKRSRFIATVVPITDENSATESINRLKTQYWDARHNVYAYSLRDGNICRFSDDGEPQGTAGMPVLEVIKKNGVTDVLIVVTRYFGGVLLGTGGLVRAYSHSAKLGLESSGIVTMLPATECEIRCDYSQYASINSLLFGYGAQILSSEFKESVQIVFAVETDLLNKLQEELTDLTRGTTLISIGKSFFMPFEN